MMANRHGLAWIPLASALALFGCATSETLEAGDTARAAPSVETGAEDQERFAVLSGPQTGIELTVMDRRWAANTQELLLHHTVLWVRFENRGSSSLRFRPDDLLLQIDERGVPAADINRLVSQGRAGGYQEARLAKTTGLKATTLAPGDRAQGFVFFPRKLEAGRDEVVALRVTVFDEHHDRVLEELELPLDLVR